MPSCACPEGLMYYTGKKCGICLAAQLLFYNLKLQLKHIVSYFMDYRIVTSCQTTSYSIKLCIAKRTK